MKLHSPFAFWSRFLHIILLYSVSILQPNSTIASTALLGKGTDRFALLKFKESVSNDPHGVLSSWNDSIRFCSWQGIRCGSRHQRVTALKLEGYDLRGTISPYIGNLSFLRFLDLRNNSFFSKIPQEVGRLFRLQHFNLSSNMLEGNIPVNLSYCSQLRILLLGRNRLTGRIPMKLGSLIKLEVVSLSTNNLTGGIPPSLGNISSLNIVNVQYNNLVGNVPHELGRLKRLVVLYLGPNFLFGTFPPSLYNMSFMIELFITYNQFNGTLPSNIGLTLPNIQYLGFSGNEFSGTLPKSLSNASQLQMLDVSDNYFVGQVPSSLGLNLPDLRLLSFSKNFLGSYSVSSLDFISSFKNCSKFEIMSLTDNNFGGVLPNSVANLSTQLTAFIIGGNKIFGNIPPTLENLVSLTMLGLDGNLFTGVIPASLGKLKNLQSVTLYSNSLIGNIPPSIGNLTKIFKLLLFDNNLEGSIPLTITNCERLQFLDISNNSLSGAIPKELFGLLPSILFIDLSRNLLRGGLPKEVEQLKNTYLLDLSENNLSSEIPLSVGYCESLESLYLQGNSFQGTLPLTLASLRGLRHLDLSRNNLTGEIPKDLQKLPLLYLNLSFNDLEGEVPSKGVFENISAVSVVGNTELCGGVPKLQLPRCPAKDFKQGKINGLKLTIIVVCAVATFLIFSAFVIFFWRRKSEKKSSTELSTISFLSKVSYKELYRATSGFSPSMLIGTGTFGSVYKGTYNEEGNLVAIKVLNLQQKGAAKSFITECNALRNIRHRNLVKILTCCSSMDYNGNEFKALVFEYMSNGSLEKWLHSVIDRGNQATGLNLIQRLNIAVDVASAVFYLHEDFDQPIIHCDLKPSNVLLDDEMIAHVSDFGLARLISNTTGSSEEGQTSTIGIKGTVGYVPPEYTMGCRPTRQGDVYSYGILVLEMFTGKRPTDEMFKDDFNLHNFVKMALPERLVQIVDSSLLPREVEETTLRSEDGRNYSNNGGIELEAEEGNVNIEINTHLERCLLSVLEIGVACSEESLNDRMAMEDVIRKLLHARDAYLSVGICGEKRRTSYLLGARSFSEGQ